MGDQAVVRLQECAKMWQQESKTADRMGDVHEIMLFSFDA